jgi:hypothetical protein
MNIKTMQDIWNNKPVGYLRANYYSRKKLKKYEFTFKRELISRKKIEDVKLEVFATSTKAASELPEVREYLTKLHENTKIIVEAEGFDTYNVVTYRKEVA